MSLAEQDGQVMDWLALWLPMLRLVRQVEQKNMIGMVNSPLRDEEDPSPSHSVKQSSAGFVSEKKGLDGFRPLATGDVSRRVRPQTGE